MISIRLPNWKRFSLRTLFVLMAVCSSARASYELWKINPDGSGLAPFAETPGYSCGSPDWSPDGKFVAYDTWKVEETYSKSQVAVIRADGTDIRLLGPGAMPSWSPDGKQLVCHTYSRPTTIVVLNPDGSGREAIINHWGSPRWSPKGNRIASILNGGIALHDLATGTERNIFPRPYNVLHGFSISPDGLRFCFGDRTERPAGGDARRAQDDSQCAPTAQAGRGRPYVLVSRRPASCILLAPNQQERSVVYHGRR